MFASGSDVAVKQQRSTAPLAIDAKERTQDVTEKFEQTYPLPANGKVSLSNINGSVVVEAWDRNEVHVEATKIADSQETLNDVQIKVSARADAVRIEADYGSWRFRDRNEANRNRRIEVQFKLSVPRGATLNSIETINGSVTLSDFTGSTKASAVNGNVIATNLRGTSNLNTVNGEVKAEFDRVETGSSISLNTVNGSVVLMLPSDVNATVKADSLNGDISNEFGLPIKKGRYIGRNLYGRIGNGDVQIKLNSVNGPLSVNRKKDGKSLNPATNLLSPGRDGEDEDIDVDVDLDSAVSAVSAARIADKEAKAAMKEAQAELAKVRPQLEKLKVDVAPEAFNAAIVANQARMAENIARQAEAFNRMAEIGWGGRAPSMRKQMNTIKVGAKPGVTIETKGCKVSVRAWDRQEVRYVLTELGHGKRAASVTEEVSGNQVVIKAVNPDDLMSGMLGQSDSRIEIMVPATSDIKITTDSAIRVNGISGDVMLDGADEPIDIRDTSGKLTLKADDAQVRVIGFKGEADTSVDDGNVFLEGSFTRISSVATDGTVTLTLLPDANASIRSNTEIQTAGVNVTREGNDTVRIGSGSASYQFTFAEGRLVLRNANALESL